MSAKSTVTGRRSSSHMSRLGPRGGWRVRDRRGVPLVAAGASRVDRAERVVLAQDRLLELPQLRGGLEAELLVEELSERPIRLQGVGVTTRAVERHHEQRAKALVERMETDECLQLTDRFGLASDGRASPRIGRRAPPAAVPPDERSPRVRTAPRRGRRAPGPRQRASALARLVSASANDSERSADLPFGEESLELFDVDGPGRDTEDVAGLAPSRVRRPRRGASGASRRRPGRCWPRTPADSSPQSASTSRSRGTTRFRSRRSSASTPRCLSPPSGSARAVVEDLQRSEHSELDQRPPLSATRQP